MRSLMRDDSDCFGWEQSGRLGTGSNTVPGQCGGVEKTPMGVSGSIGSSLGIPRTC